MCLLDTSSGAAVSMRLILETLARQGHRCTSLSLALLDSGREVDLAGQLPADTEGETRFGRNTLRHVRRSVTHHVCLTGSSASRNLDGSEVRGFLRLVSNIIGQAQFDVAITYGSGALEKALLQRIRPHVPNIRFFLPNAEFTDASLFDQVDRVICPSAFLAAHYRETLGLQCRAVRDPFLAPAFYDRTVGDLKATARATHFVTMINPDPAKGATVFLEIADRVARERPWVTFLAVEGRSTRVDLLSRLGRSRLPRNVIWLANQPEMDRVYRQTAILLVPSLWREGAGRVVVEAQLYGIPVFASNVGGLPETLNGAGVTFTLPWACHADYTRRPDAATIHAWVAEIYRLLDNEAAYRAKACAARAAALPFLVDGRAEEIAEAYA
jgi:glycosyltransferase involved in cell wall biosynthesis